MVKEENDFGFSFTSEEEHLMSLQTKSNIQAKQISSLVMPLLKNLMLNPDKEMIRWPDRAPKIQAIIDKINNILEEGM